MKTIVLLSAFFVATTCLADPSLNLVAGEAPPYVMPQSGSHKGDGVAFDLLGELAKVLKIPRHQIQKMPFQRSLLMGKNQKKTIFIAARIPEREQEYTWIAPLLPEELVLISHVRWKNEHEKIKQSLTEPISVWRSSICERLALKKQYQKIQLASNEETNARKIHDGRTKLWLASWNMARQAYINAGLNPNDLVKLASYERFDIYLVGSKDLSQTEATKWASALKEIQSNGRYRQILSQYQYQEP